MRWFFGRRNPHVPEPTVDCAICETLTFETLTEHLQHLHLNEMLAMDVDPDTNHAAIARPCR